jgi:hypothetical protein
MGSGSGHRNRPKHVKGDALIDIANIGNFLVIFAFLIEIIAGKTQHHQTLVLVLMVKFFKSAKLGCKTAVAGRINNQQGFACVNLADI